MCFHPSVSEVVYVSDELSSSVSVWRSDLSSELQFVGTLKEPFAGNTTAEIAMHKSGRMLYCANRGHDSIACFSTDPSTGLILALVNHVSAGGLVPRHFTQMLDGTRLVIACQHSSKITAYRVDPSNGQVLSPTDGPAMVWDIALNDDTPIRPVCILPC
jgi:6-phosphogluconolactonase